MSCNLAGEADRCGAIRPAEVMTSENVTVEDVLSPVEKVRPRIAAQNADTRIGGVIVPLTPLPRSTVNCWRPPTVKVYRASLKLIGLAELTEAMVLAVMPTAADVDGSGQAGVIRVQDQRARAGLGQAGRRNQGRVDREVARAVLVNDQLAGTRGRSGSRRLSALRRRSASRGCRPDWSVFAPDSESV